MPMKTALARVKLFSNGFVMIGLIYRLSEVAPPSFVDFMFFWTVDVHCLVLGDFNAPYVDWRSGLFAPAEDRFSWELLDAVCEHATAE